LERGGLTGPAAPIKALVPADDQKTFQVELAPLQSVFIDDDQIFIFRRIMIKNQIFRQGFILLPDAFLDHFAKTYFSPHPMAVFTNLRLSVMEGGREMTALQAGVAPGPANFRLVRTFPSPFSFLTATLICEDIPRSVGRSTLNIMIAVLAGIILIGLVAIYKSAQAVVELSERRSGFVSSVTHELKTPLTNIRLYVEMLEQGIAQDREREEDYLKILGSESARLSRLINNVLELSKLEKNQRHMDLQPGTFADVIESVEAVMKEKLKQEGFALRVKTGDIRPFAYDGEVMIQVLINLIENSIKFGNTFLRKEIILKISQPSARTLISVSDTGPGIPKNALKKIFEDFYRPDTTFARSTGGTGIGLALVKKFVVAMGGSVTAANNPGRGCTITISMPS
jgi:signal transduction histidine kinase